MRRSRSWTRPCADAAVAGTVISRAAASAVLRSFMDPPYRATPIDATQPGFRRPTRPHFGSAAAAFTVSEPGPYAPATCVPHHGQMRRYWLGWVLVCALTVAGCQRPHRPDPPPASGTVERT